MIELSVIVFSVLISLSIYLSARLISNNVCPSNVSYRDATNLTISIMESSNNTDQLSTEELKKKYLEIYKSVLKDINKIYP